MPNSATAVPSHPPQPVIRKTTGRQPASPQDLERLTRSAPALATLCLLLCLSSACLAQELVAHWPFDSAAGNVLPDAAANGHDATYASKDGAAPALVEGMHGQALQMTAAQEQYLTVAGSEALNFDGPFSVMAWIKPTARNATYEIACFKGDKSGDPPWPGWRLRYFWARATLQLGAPDGAEPTLSSAEWSVPAGFWSHVASTWDGQKMHLYINGVERAVSDYAGTIAPQAKSRPMILGNYLGRKNAYAFDGLMDDIRIYKGALTEDQVFEVASRIGAQ